MDPEEGEEKPVTQFGKEPGPADGYARMMVVGTSTWSSSKGDVIDSGEQ